MTKPDDLREALLDLKAFAEAHHGDEQPNVWLHGLTIDVPSRIDAVLAALTAASGVERPIDETQVIEWLEEEGVVIWGDEGHRQRFLDILAAERAIPATDAEGSSHDQA